MNRTLLGHNKDGQSKNKMDKISNKGDGHNMVHKGIEMSRRKDSHRQKQMGRNIGSMETKRYLETTKKT